MHLLGSSSRDEPRPKLLSASIRQSFGSSDEPRQRSMAYIPLFHRWHIRTSSPSKVEIINELLVDEVKNIFTLKSMQTQKGKNELLEFVEGFNRQFSTE